MPRITRKFRFCAAHRILGHEGRCRYIHGHNYLAEVTVYGPTLDELDMLLDFKELKHSVGGWIQNWWDHNVILHKDDPLVKLRELVKGHEIWLRQEERLSPTLLEAEVVGLVKDVFGDREPFVLEDNPTAEVMSRYLLWAAHKILEPGGFQVETVVLYETEECSATSYRTVVKL